MIASIFFMLSPLVRLFGPLAPAVPRGKRCDATHCGRITYTWKAIWCLCSVYNASNRFNLILMVAVFPFIQRDYFASRIAQTGESKSEANHGFAEGFAKCGMKISIGRTTCLRDKILMGNPPANLEPLPFANSVVIGSEFVIYYRAVRNL
jgi:hypothetical protein